MRGRRTMPRTGHPRGTDLGRGTEGSRATMTRLRVLLVALTVIGAAACDGAASLQPSASSIDLGSLAPPATPTVRAAASDALTTPPGARLAAGGGPVVDGTLGSWTLD